MGPGGSGGSIFLSIRSSQVALTFKRFGERVRLVYINSYMLGIIAAVVGTLTTKYVWDRWLSKSSRITEQKCKDNQSLCFLNVVAKITEVTTKITKIGDDLSCGDATFESIKLNNEKTARTLKLILLTLSELCLVGEGCNEKTKRRIEEELLR